MPYNYRPLTATQACAIVAEHPDEKAKEATRVAYVNLEGIYKEIACAAIRKQTSLQNGILATEEEVITLIIKDLELNGFTVKYTKPNRNTHELGYFTITW